MLGRMSAEKPVPTIGTQRSTLPNTWISTMPIQKVGSDSPTNAEVITAMSAQPFGRSPAMVPSTVPNRPPSSRPPPASDRVYGKLRADHGKDRLARGEAQAEITGGGAAEEIEELHQHRAVQAEIVAFGLEDFFARRRAAEDERDGIAGDQVHGDEDERPGQQQHRE